MLKKHIKRIKMILEYREFIKDMIEHDLVLSMQNYVQHQNISTLEHSIYVSYTSYKVSKWLNLNYQSVARGALVHDFFLYDWHHLEHAEKQKLWELHGFTHANTALQNASLYFDLTDIEKDIVAKHMWPLNWRFPRYKESFLVMLVDKYCSIREILDHKSHSSIRGLTGMVLASEIAY